MRRKSVPSAAATAAAALVDSCITMLVAVLVDIPKGKDGVALCVRRAVCTALLHILPHGYGVAAVLPKGDGVLGISRVLVAAGVYSCICLVKLAHALHLLFLLIIYHDETLIKPPQKPHHSAAILDPAGCPLKDL